MAILTILERMCFLADVADALLNEKGRARFFSSFYWRLNPGGNITHSIFDHAEKQLAKMIQQDEYKK